MGTSHQRNCIAPLLMVWFMMIMLITPSSCQASAYICPTSTSISPCVCKQYNSLFNDGIWLDCQNKNLSDSKISTILDKVLVAQGLSRVVKISASNNQLTKIPDQVSKFPYLAEVDMLNNQITEIPNNGGKTFINSKNLKTGAMIPIDLRGNLIQSIPPGVFDFSTVKDLSITLGLSNNQIRSLSSDTFKFPFAFVVRILMANNKISSLPFGAFNFPSAVEVLISMENNFVNIGDPYFPSGMFNFPSAQIVALDFSNNGVTDVSCGMFIYPLTSSVHLFFYSNKIRYVRSCAFFFPSASDVIISLDHNLIQAINPGAFHFPWALSVQMYLGNNQISEIPPNTFVHGNYVQLNLQNNQLKRFESAVFKSPLTNLIGRNYLRIGGNPIDCSSDPCHLAWLFQSANSTRMLNYINQDKICSNDVGSRPFSALSSFPFSNNCGLCPN